LICVIFRGALPPELGAFPQRTTSVYSKQTQSSWRSNCIFLLGYLASVLEVTTRQEGLNQIRVTAPSYARPTVAGVNEPVPAPFVLTGWETIPNLPAPQFVSENHKLIKAGASADSVILLRSGTVKLTCKPRLGPEMIVAIRSSGWFLGADAAFLGGPHGLTATTLSACEVSVIPVQFFLEAARTAGPLASYVNTMLCHGSEAYLSSLIELRTASADERLDKFVSDLQAITASTGAARPRLKQIEVARALAITPEHLSRLKSRKRLAHL
jgi:CRP-like cAMP-binding protein